MLGTSPSQHHFKKLSELIAFAGQILVRWIKQVKPKPPRSYTDQPDHFYTDQPNADWVLQLRY